MPKIFRLKDKVTGKVLMRKSLDARECLGMDPGRYSLMDEGVKVTPLTHENRVLHEKFSETVTAAPAVPAKASSPAPAPEKKQPSQATTEKRNAALAKARAAAAANRAAKAAQSDNSVSA